MTGCEIERASLQARIKYSREVADMYEVSADFCSNRADYELLIGMAARALMDAYELQAELDEVE